jgi:hypothetical protein
MRSRELYLPWVGRTGAGHGSCRFSGAGGARLALRAAPSLAVVEEVAVSRAGDLDAASRAAISGAEERAAERAEAEAELRPLTFGALAGDSGRAVSLPILSFTEPTSGPTSDPVLWRPSIWRSLAIAAAVAAELLFTLGDESRELRKASVAPCRASFRDTWGANRWFADLAASPFMEIDIPGKFHTLDSHTQG